MVFVEHALKQALEIVILHQPILIILLDVKGHVAGEVLLDRDQVLYIHVV